MAFQNGRNQGRPCGLHGGDAAACTASTTTWSVGDFPGRQTGMMCKQQRLMTRTESLSSLLPSFTFSASPGRSSGRPMGWSLDRIGPPGEPSLPRRAVEKDEQGVPRCTTLAAGTRERSRATLDITVRSWLVPWRMSHSSERQPRLRKAAESRPHPLKISMISGAD